jgi:D-serine deaminase-like pyridoxal phosphate-dependent protein
MDASRMAPLQSQAHELAALLAAHEKAALKAWAGEKEQLEALIASLNQSQDILKREKQRVKAELKAALSKASAAHKQSSSKPSTAASEGTPADVVDLQLKLVDLNNRFVCRKSRVVSSDLDQYHQLLPTISTVCNSSRMLDIDETLTTVAQELQSAPPLERELHSTRLVVMQVRSVREMRYLCICLGECLHAPITAVCLQPQDTRRILQNEIEALRTSIFHIESQQKYEAEKRR